jgi:hypothetical protein
MAGSRKIGQPFQEGTTFNGKHLVRWPRCGNSIP